MFLNDIFNFKKNDKDNDDEDLYKILGCDPTSSSEQILTEYRNKALQLHPDKAPTDEERKKNEKQFCRLTHAKEILSDPKKRQNYDCWRESGIQIPFARWTTLTNNQGHSSIHWMNSKRNQPKALTDCEELNESTNQSGNYFPQQQEHHINRSPDKILQMFRNYQI